MRTFNVLYIDDDLVNEKEKQDKIDPLVRALSSQEKVRFELEYPEKLEDFVDSISEKYPDIDAVMIDLKLNENHTGRENFATYPAQILATAIRTYQNGENKKFEEFPIILISSWENMKALYESDVKSHDLFDFFISKNDLAQKGKEYENQISSFIKAYKKIGFNKKMSETLGIDKEAYERLNINYESEDELISEISQFVFKQIIKRNGILINEDVLAARLGIDFMISKDWVRLKEKLNTILYKGVFSDNWNRWWSNDLLEWWEDEISSDVILINSEASNRVDLLKEKLGLLNLETAKPIENFMGSSFWTVCKALKKPLDIYDGIVVNTKNEVWQDKEYVSPTAVFEGNSKSLGIKLHPNEKDRLSDLKKLYAERKYDNK